MATTQVGEVELIAKIDTSSYERGASKIEKANSDIEKSTDSAANKSDKAWKSFSGNVSKYSKIITAAGVAAAGAIVKSSVSAFADYEQLVGGVDTLFKQSSNQVQRYADTAYRTAGLSANAYMETVTSFSASLLQGLGGDTKRAAQIADMAVTDMADNANKMGTGIELIQNAYQGFAKDNFTMLDNLKLGYGGTAGEMARLINESGILGKSFTATAENVKDIPFDQLIKAINTVQKRMGITGTTALEASDTISGSLASTKAAWENLLTAFGTGDTEKVNASFEALVESGTNFVQNVGAILPSIFEGMGKALGLAVQEIPVVRDFFNFISDNKDVLTSIAVGIGSVVLAMKAWQVATNLVAIAQGALNAVMALNPISVVIVAIAALTAGLIYFFTQTETGRKLLDGFMQTAVKVFDAVKGAIMGAFDWVKKNWPLLLGILIGPFAPAVVLIIKNFDKIKSALGSVWNWIKGVFSTIGSIAANVIKTPVNAILRFAENTINGFIRTLNSVIGTINKLPGVNIGTLSTLSIPRLAQGGIVPATPGGILANIGEGRETEVVMPLSKLDEVLSKERSERPESSRSVTINLSGVFATSASEQRRVAQQIADALNQVEAARGY